MTKSIITANRFPGAAGAHRSATRGLALLGTALGSTLIVVAPADAQNTVSTNNTTDYTLIETMARSGGPRTIDVATSGGNILIDEANVNNTAANNPNNVTGAGIAAVNTGTGTITIRDGNVTATGTGQTNAIDARGQGGAINITNTGTVQTSGNNSDVAIVALSNGGNITINSNVATGQRRGIFTGGNGGNFGVTGIVTINSTNATANGTGLVNAIIAQGYGAVINSGTASVTNANGVQGTAIFANVSAGGVVVNAGTTTAFGQNQAAMQLFSEGAVDVTSGNVRTTQNSDGISVASGTDVIVRSATISIEGTGGGRGIVLGGNAGGGGFNSGANGFAYTSAAVISDSISTVGTGAYGIYATPTGTGATTITSRDITTTGAGAYGIYETAIGTGSIGGGSIITSTGQLKTSNANGIQVNAGPGAVTVNNTGTITVAGNQSSAINVVGTTGPVTINTVGGTSMSSGDNGHAIRVSTTSGPITINAGTSTTTGAYNENLAESSDAISVNASGAAAIGITSADASSAGQFGSAIFAVTNGGSVTVNSTNATTTGVGGNVIGASARGTAGGDATINAVTSTAAGLGISATATAGNATVNAGTSTAAAGTAVSATAGRGLAAVTVTGTAAGGGNGANGVFATGTTEVTLAIGAASSNGAATSTTNTRTGVTTTRRSDAVSAATTGGAITASVGSATATGGIGVNATTGATFTADAVRLIATGAGGAITLNSTGTLASTSGYGVYANAGATDLATGTVTTAGANVAGILVTTAGAAVPTGAIKIASGPITTSGANSQGILVMNAGGPVTINANDVRTGSGAAIVVQPTSGSTGPINVQAGIVRSGATSAAINLSSNGINGPITADVVDSVSIGAAIDARSVGAVSVTGGAVQTTGANATGLVAISTGGNATVNSTNLTSANRGIYAQGLDDVTVTSGTLVSTNADFGLIARTSAASNNDPVVGTVEGVVTVNSTNLTATAIGINAFGPRATVNVNSGTVTTQTGNAIQAFGIDVNVNSGTINTGDVGINAGMGTGATRRGATVVNSGTINLGGVAGTTAGGIIASGASANITSGTIIATGAGNRFGISAQVPTSTVAGTTSAGALSVTTGSITTVGDGAYGVQAITDSGALLVRSTGTITTVGTTRLAGNQPRYSAGIVAFSPAGAVMIESNNIVTSGAQSDGIRVEAGSGNQGTFTASPNNAAAPVSVTTSGLTQTNGANAAGINVFAGGGTVTINNTGTVQTTNNGATGISVQSPGAGAVNVVSNAVTTQGTSSTGIAVNTDTGAIGITATSVAAAGAESAAIRAQSNSGAITVQSGTITSAFASPAISARSGGAVAITAATTTVTANPATGGGAGGLTVSGANAIDGRSTNGAVTITAGTVNASNGTAINAQAGTTANVAVTTVANATGDDSAGVRAVGGTGVTLNVANATSTGATVNGRADAIFAEALAGAVNATVGSASAQGANADGVHLVANGTGGAATLSVSGTVTSAGGYGVFIDPPGNVNVTVASGATVSGAQGGLNTASDTGVNTITNAGTIRGTNGAAIVALGTTTLDNRGTLAGSGGTAVQLGATNDAVTLRTGSVVTGAIVGGGGTDSATLIGTGTAPVATQTVAAFQGFDSLTVQSGYWTAPATNASTVARTIIASGSTLEVQNGATGIAGYQSGTYADNGSLIVRSTAASAGNTFGASTVTGAGTVLFTGPGTATLGGPNTLANTGTNTVDTGSTVLVTGAQGGNFVNNGTFQVGTGGTTGNFAGNLVDNGTLIVNRSDLYNYTGALTGAGLFIKQGAGQVVFGTGYAFTGTTQLNGGSIRLTQPVAANTELDIQGTGTVDLSGQTNTIAELMGSSGGTVNIAGGSLTDNQNTNTTFAGALVGTGGSFTKGGTGTLNLTGVSTYTGPTTVNGGRLAVNGSIVSPVTVNAGATLGGNGSVGTTVIASGGTFAPGNSIGTTTVNGNLTFAAGSIYAVEANAAGAADRINATGIATLAGTVQVNAAAGTYNQLTTYTILTAAGGVNGRFANVTSNFAFLSPLLGYSTNAVTLSLARNDLAFGAAATSANQLAVANAVAARGLGDPVFNAVLFQTALAAPAVFNQLSGEIFASLPSELTDQGRRVREAVLDRGVMPGEGFGLWGNFLQSSGHSRQQPGVARIRSNRTGGVGGLDYVTADGVRLGVYGGYQDDRSRLRNRAESAHTETYHAGATAAWVDGPVSIQTGADYAWHDIESRRMLTTTGVAGTAVASPDAYSAQLYAEFGYRLLDGPITVTPFARNAYTRTRVKAFVETGSAAALAVSRDRRDVDFASVGVRVGGDAPFARTMALLPAMSIAYSRGFGDRDGTSVARFSGTGPAFAVSGASLGKDTLTVDGGFDLRFGQQLTLGAHGFGSTSKTWGDYGLRASLGFRF